MNSDYFDSPSVSMRLEYERKNVLTYCLLGDPELDVYTNQPVAFNNPFIEEICVGQNISIPIKNDFNETLSNARVNFRSSMGLFHTYYASNEGILDLQVPALNDQTYNVCITGHNSIPSYFNFTPKLDDVVPKVSNLTIESVFLILSNNNFSNCSIYPMDNSTQIIDLYECYLDVLNQGTYSYLIIARDYANNTNIFYNASNIFWIRRNPNEGENLLIISVSSSIK